MDYYFLFHEQDPLPDENDDDRYNKTSTTGLLPQPPRISSLHHTSLARHNCGDLYGAMMISVVLPSWREGQ